VVRPRKRRGASPKVYQELDLTRVRMSLPRTEIKRGNEFSVQETTGKGSEPGKKWICPVCSITLEPGPSHTVAWDIHRGVETRRHFHNHCWKIFDGVLL
jgi:hypothetical protein